MYRKLNKTDRAIFEAFYELRKQYPVNKIKVITLCSYAKINKTTFYYRYKDINDVCYKYDCFLIDDALKNFNMQHLIYDEPMTFINELKDCFRPHFKEFIVVGKGREVELIYNIENKILRLFATSINKNTDEFLLRFLLGGIFAIIDRYYFNDERRLKFNIDDVDKQLCEILKSCIVAYPKTIKYATKDS